MTKEENVNIEQFRAEIMELLEKEKCTPLDDSVAEDISCRVWNKAIQTAIGVVRTAGKEKIENNRDEADSFLRKDDGVFENIISKDLWACFRKPREDTSEPEE